MSITEKPFVVQCGREKVSAVVYAQSRPSRLLQLIHGHHQDGHWAPYQSLIEPFLLNGWDVVVHKTTRKQTLIESKRWHHPKLSSTHLDSMQYAWYVPSLAQEQAQANAVLACMMREQHYSHVAILGHSLHAHIAYELAREGVRNARRTVIALTPVIDLERQREKKLEQIGIPSTNDTRFVEGGATTHHDKYCCVRQIMVYRNDFWNDYETRVQRDAARTAIAQWFGPSIIIGGEEDTTLGPDEITTAMTASRGCATLLTYGGGHRPNIAEARELGQKLVTMLR